MERTEREACHLSLVQAAWNFTAVVPYVFAHGVSSIHAAHSSM